MPIPNEVLQLENRYIGRDGEPTLAAAYQILKQLWVEGNRDREVLLHLLFLSWYGMCEPPFLTGFGLNADGSFRRFQPSDEEMTELPAMFNQVHEYIQPIILDDAEMLYVVGLMANLFPWLLGNTTEWMERSDMYRRQYRALKPNGVDPAVFQGRGMYGDYFMGQAKAVDGY
jgi:hypothetical protein